MPHQRSYQTAHVGVQGSDKMEQLLHTLVFVQRTQSLTTGALPNNPLRYAHFLNVCIGINGVNRKRTILQKLSQFLSLFRLRFHIYLF